MVRGRPKERMTVSLQPRTYRFLQQGHVNASGLVDRLVQLYIDEEIDL